MKVHFLFNELCLLFQYSVLGLLINVSPFSYKRIECDPNEINQTLPPGKWSLAQKVGKGEMVGAQVSLEVALEALNISCFLDLWSYLFS